MISRIFFPIGQGAFYAERHNNFNIVYDCGNADLKPSMRSKNIISQNFSKNEKINILFISHLDWDHISLLETLKNKVSSIDYVILPLLHDEQKILLSNIHRTLGYSSYSIIDSPQDFFGDKVKIVHVESSENDEVNERVIDLDGDDNLDRNDNLDRKIASGTRIIIGNDNWCFIPFNVKNTERSKLLEKKLSEAGFDVEKLKTKSEYALKQILNKKEKNKLKEIYKSLDGDINENSLVVYSGPKIECKKSCSLRHFRNDFSYMEWSGFNYSELTCKVGCIYTGDSDLNKFDIKKIYEKQWNMVGTVQIPHHGSIKNFNSSFLTSEYLIFPVSFGTNNSYGHPSYKLINDIIRNGSYVISITEKLDSGYIQVLRPWCI